MKITITRKDKRHTLTCTRDDGTHDSANLGPTLPHHDLAHFVVERRLALKDGFFGRIAAGYSMAQLADMDFIRNSGAQSLLAEIATRALQALSSGACIPDQYADLVNAELSQWSIPSITLEPATARAMLAEFEVLVSRYGSLPDGQSLELRFDVRTRSETATCPG